MRVPDQLLSSVDLHNPGGSVWLSSAPQFACARIDVSGQSNWPAKKAAKRLEASAVTFVFHFPFLLLALPN